jgi:hypothetical protein
MATTIIIVCVCFLLAQALFINGVEMASSGKTEILPDGSHKDSEMILYPIAKEVNKTKERNVLYTNERLYALMNNISNVYAAIDCKPDKIGIDHIYFASPDKRAIFRQLISKIEKDFNLSVSNVEGEGDFYFSIIEKTHVYSKYLRMPTFGCIKCMPSFWGSLTYWPFISIAFPSIEYKLLLWVCDIVILVPICYFIHKKLDK